MKIILTTLIAVFSFASLFSQDSSQQFITSDIDNFWTAYDKIVATKDSALQYDHLNKNFIDKGSPGLKAIMEARGYTDRSYIEAINNYPLFWNSIRQNTLRAKEFAKDIATNINQLKKIYPELKPAKIYFTIGALRTGGTTLNGRVLIGSEVALTDRSAVTSELPNSFSHLRSHFDTDPIKEVVFLNVHEYIHAQQKTTIANSLLGQAVLEGAAEFVTVLATGKPSTTPAIKYGKENAERVRNRFSSEMFNPFTGFWLYSNQANEFNVRDLGYYVGYVICEKYYSKASNKKAAIREMLELDYNNETALLQFVDRSGYFTEPMSRIKEKFENDRPTVVKINEIRNGDQRVDPALTQITIEFSKPMDDRYRNFELGPLGEDNLLRLKSFKGFSADGRSVTFEIELKKDRQYQIIVGAGFRSKVNLSLKPYLVDFKTADK